MPDEYPRIVSSLRELVEWSLLQPPYGGIDGPYQPDMSLYTQDNYWRGRASYEAWLQLLRSLQQDFSHNPLLPYDEDVRSEIVKEPRGDLERICDVTIQVLLPKDVGLKASLEGFFGPQIPKRSMPFQASDCIRARTWEDDGKRLRKPHEGEPPFWVKRFSPRRGK